MTLRIQDVAIALLLGAAISCGGSGDDDDGADATSEPTATDPSTSPTGSSDPDASGTNPTAPSESGSESGSGECGAGMACTPAVPDGWFGPVAYSRGEPGAEPTCGGGYPNTGSTLFEGYSDPGPAICDCECNVNMLALCNVNSYNYLDAACTMFGVIAEVSADCVGFEVDGAAQIILFETGPPVCQRTLIEEFPEPDWEGRITTCRADEEAEPVECSTGVCAPVAPDGFEAELCMFAPGDHECPGDGFTEKFTFLSGTDDGRSCSECECGTGTATCAGATAQFFDAPACGGSLVADVAPSTCAPGAAGAQSLSLDFPGAAACPVTVPSQPEGSVAPSGGLTFCCRP